VSDTIDAVAHAKALNTQRLKAWEEGKALLDEVAQRGDGMSAEDTEKWQRINADIDRLDAERDVYLTAERRENEAAEIRDAELRDFGEQRVQRRDVEERQRIAQTLRSMATSPVGSVQLEIDVRPAFEERALIRAGMAPSEARALAWDTGSIASGVPVTTSRTLYQYLEATMAMFRAPTTKFNTTSGEQMKFPRLAAHAIATQVSGQGTALAGTDPTFASMTMDAYKYGELVLVANEVISDTGFDVISFLMADIGRALGRKIDTDLVTGSGSGKPNGIMTAIAGSGTVVTGGSLLTGTVENLIDLQYSVNDAYRDSGNAAWLMKDSSAGVFRKLRDGAGGTVGAFLWEPSLFNGIQTGTPDRLFGDPVYRDPNVAAMGSDAKTVAYGDFSAYYIRTVGNVVVERDDSRYFDTDQVAFRGKWRVDGDLIDTTAVNALHQAVT
jgi:HK97 family phage major capsid protein